MGADTRRAPRQQPPGGFGTLEGSATLLRLALRRDRVRLLSWTLGITGFLVASAVGLGDVVPDARARATRAELMSSPTIRALRGPGYGLDDYSYGAMVAHELLLFGAVAVALMSLLIVTRHTRAEEEAGRTELLRACVLGRHAPLVAGLGVAVIANVVIAGATAFLLVATIGELGPTGAVVFGLALAATGVVFAMVAAVSVQLTANSRTANGITGVVLAVAFMSRAVGDAGGVEDRTLSWLSPLGWSQATRPFVDERLWPLALGLGLCVVLGIVATTLADRRDLGAGLLPPRPGPPTASEVLTHPLGFAWRLQRNALFGWTIGATAIGASFGAIIGDIDTFLEQNPQLVDIFGAGGDRLLDAFLATVMLLIALSATGFALQATHRLHLEESEGRAEPLLATSLSRVRWAMSHLALSLVGGSVVVCAGGLGLGVSAALDQADPTLIGQMLLAGLANTPAIWVVAGLVVAVYGMGGRGIGLGWAVVAYGTFIGLLAEVLDLPEALRGLSPYHHVPDLPAASVDSAALGVLAALLAIATLLVGVGLVALTRRDLHTP
jgi:ABC-2 type transport system permease protein